MTSYRGEPTQPGPRISRICRVGHIVEGANVLMVRGGRHCRACKAARDKRYLDAHPKPRDDSDRAGDRRYRERNSPKIRDARVRYYASEKGKATQVRHQAKLRAEPLKRAAWRQVRSAKEAGDLVASPCQTCGASKVQAHHHRGYDHPLDVVWLCPLHHRQAHQGRPVTEDR